MCGVSLLRDQPHDEGQDEGEDGNGRLNGGGVGGVGVAEAKQEQQLVAKDAEDQTQEAKQSALRISPHLLSPAFS